MTSSTKLEVHNVSQRRQSRTEPRPQGTCIKHFVKIGPAVPEICSQTDRQTHIQIDKLIVIPRSPTGEVTRKQNTTYTRNTENKKKTCSQNKLSPGFVHLLWPSARKWSGPYFCSPRDRTGQQSNQCDLSYWFFSVTVIVTVNKKYFSYSYSYENFWVTVNFRQ